MNRERVRALLDAYGAQPAQWPQAERDAAAAVIATDPALQRQQAQAQALDAWLDALPLEAVDPALSARILAQLPAGEESAPGAGLWSWALQSWWRPAALACAPLALGLAIGLGGLMGEQPEAELAWSWQDEEQHLFAFTLGEPAYE